MTYNDKNRINECIADTLAAVAEMRAEGAENIIKRQMLQKLQEVDSLLCELQHWTTHESAPAITDHVEVEHRRGGVLLKDTITNMVF